MAKKHKILVNINIDKEILKGEFGFLVNETKLNHLNQ